MNWTFFWQLMLAIAFWRIVWVLIKIAYRKLRGDQGQTEKERL